MPPSRSARTSGAGTDGASASGRRCAEDRLIRDLRRHAAGPHACARGCWMTLADLDGRDLPGRPRAGCSRRDRHLRHPGSAQFACGRRDAMHGAHLGRIGHSTRLTTRAFAHMLPRHSCARSQGIHASRRRRISQPRPRQSTNISGRTIRFWPLTAMSATCPPRMARSIPSMDFDMLWEVAAEQQKAHPRHRRGAEDRRHADPGHRPRPRGRGDFLASAGGAGLQR